MMCVFRKFNTVKEVNLYKVMKQTPYGTKEKGFYDEVNLA